jgi:hypothetical protein
MVGTVSAICFMPSSLRTHSSLSHIRCCINDGYTIGAIDWHTLANQILSQPFCSLIVYPILTAPLPIMLLAVIMAKLNYGSR